MDRPDVQAKRHGFWRLKTLRQASRLVFLDETGVNLSMTRAYARAPSGERAVAAVPKNWGDSVTVVAALTLDGIIDAYAAFAEAAKTKALKVIITA